MKFKKFLALSLAAAMMTTGVPGVGMLDGAVNVMAAETPTPTDAITVVDIDDTEDDIKATFTTESTKSTLVKGDNELESTYSGENIDPVPSLKVGETELYLNRDYTYSYIKVTDRGTVNQKVETVSSITDAGDYEIKFTFKGTYSSHGTATVKLTVEQAATNSVIVTSSNSKVTDGYLVNADDKVKEPEVTVYAPDGKTALKKGIDYNVTYTAADGIHGTIGVEVLATSNNIMAGTYGGSDELDYYVVKTIKDTDISIALAKNTDGTYKVTPTLALGGSAGTEWNYTIVDASTLGDKTADSKKDTSALGAGEYIITVTGVVAKGYNGTTIQKRFTIS